MRAGTHLVHIHIFKTIQIQIRILDKAYNLLLKLAWRFHQFNGALNWNIIHINNVNSGRKRSTDSLHFCQLLKFADVCQVKQQIALRNNRNHFQEFFIFILIISADAVFQEPKLIENIFQESAICELGVSFLEDGREFSYDFWYDTKKEEYPYEKFSEIIRDQYGNEVYIRCKFLISHICFR